MLRLLHILNGLFLFLFLISAMVQFNDPDPWLWVLIYLLAAGACGQYYTKLKLWQLPAVVGLCALLGMVSLLPEIVESSSSIHWDEVFMRASMSSSLVEWVREAGGLLIIALWMAVLLILDLKKTSQSE